MLTDHCNIFKVFISKHIKLRTAILLALQFVSLKILSAPFVLLSYIGLFFSQRVYAFFQNINIKILLELDYFWKSDLYATEENLRNILQITKDKSIIKQIAKTSMITKYFEDVSHYDWYFRLVNKKKYIAFGKSMKINNYSGIPIESMGVDKKIIFCHSHSSNMTFSILKIGSLTNSSLNTLLVQRSYSKIMYSFLDNIANSLDARHLEYYDPFINTPISLIKKVKTSHIVHLYVDLPIQISLKNFSSVEISLFGKKAIVNDSSARLAIGFDALCIPIFVNKNEINILKPIDCGLVDGTKQTKILKGMQLIFNQLSHYWVKYPGQWYMLRNSEYFFRKTTFHKGPQ